VSTILNLLHRYGQRAVVEVRSWYYGRLFSTCGKDLKVYGRLTVYSPHLIVCGNGCSLNDGVILNATGARITLGDHVTLSPGVMIQCGRLNVRPSGQERHHEYGPIEIGSNVWIGSGAHVLAGTTVGAGATVAANAVVSRSVEADVFVAGVPARPVELGLVGGAR
jgi:maltose O-acetyltransferase